MESTFVNFNKNNALSKKSKLQNNKQDNIYIIF